MGSFAVERFGTERLQETTREEIETRFRLLQEMAALASTPARDHAGDNVHS